MKELGQDDKEALDSAHWLGLSIYEQEKFREAEGFFRQAVEGQTRVLGYDRLETYESAY